MSSWEVGTTCTDCAVLDDEYQDTTRWPWLAPTLRTMADEVAGACAWAPVSEPMPDTPEMASVARAAPTAARRRTRLGPCGVPALHVLEDTTDVPCLS